MYALCCDVVVPNVSQVVSDSCRTVFDCRQRVWSQMPLILTVVHAPFGMFNPVRIVLSLVRNVVGLLPRLLGAYTMIGTKPVVYQYTCLLISRN